jgi:hypothetical protein
VRFKSAAAASAELSINMVSKNVFILITHPCIF